MGKGGWVFAYGSLIWRPDFPFEDRVPARAWGWHRAFCVYSWVWRGTRQRPGLVLGLDRGGSCQGVAFRVRPGDWEETLAGLRARELVTHVYREAHLDVALEGARRRQEAVAYVVRRGHPQYAGRLHIRDQARIIARAKGRGGPNGAYVAETLAALKGLGVRDPGLERLGSELSLRPPRRA